MKMNFIKDKFSIVKSFLAVFAMLFVSAQVHAQCDNLNLACNGSINVSINEDCFAAITVDLILENPPFDEFPNLGDYEITLKDENGDIITPSNQIGDQYVGQTIEASVALTPCGISCWGNIVVEDKIGPKFWDCNNGFLPDHILTCSEYGNGDGPANPSVGGFCSVNDMVVFEDDTTSVSCMGAYAITIVRTWIATDASGNSSTCQQNILVEKADISDIVFPDDYIIEITSQNLCNQATNLTPARTGEPMGIDCPNIMYFYSDIDYPQCGIQVKMLRDWFVIDWCTGQTASDGQIIKVIDNVPPVSGCTMDTLFLPRDPASCLAYPVLNPMGLDGFDKFGEVLSLTDCSGPIDIEVGYLPAEAGTDQPVDGPYRIIQPNNNNLYELPAIEQAAWIRYCFTDACGNSTKVDPTPNNPDDADNTCCYFEIFTQDASPPTAICEGFTKIPLLASGFTEVPAESFDDHSFDPCGEISHFMVKREQTSCTGFADEATDFQESIHFCCADLGKNITIRLRVYDVDGNFSECLGLACVEDQGVTSVVCMDATVNLDCGEDYTDRSLTGVPSGGSNECNNGIKVGDDQFSLANFDLSCGIGTIVRTVRVTDLNDQLLRTCRQDIVFDEDDNPTPLTDGDYDFPDDVTVDICDPNFSIDPSVTGIPTTTKTFGCLNIAISHEDSSPSISNTSGVCYFIERTWRVVDWCRYDPANPDEHVLIGTQRITITNSSVPTFNCPNSNLEFTAVAGACEAQVDIAVDISTTCNAVHVGTWAIDEDNNGSTDQTGTGLEISGVFPVGTHKVTFSSNNECGGGQANCVVTFVVKGDRGPLPICQSSIIVSLGVSGTLEVWASDFDFKSEGGCDGNDDLTFSFVAPTDSAYPQTNQTYDCTDIPNGVAAALPVVVYIVDESGATSSCFSEIVIQDTQDVCMDQTSNTTVGGNVLTEFQEPIEEVMVGLHNMTMNESVMDMTTTNGEFAFGEVAFYDHYELYPEKNDDYLNGVSTLDIVLIQRHILGQQVLDSPYKMIAADADKSMSVTAVDLIELRKLILGIYNELPENDSWVFVPEAQEFVDQMNPWEYDEEINIQSLYMSEMEADFVAVKVGDVNNSVALNALTEGKIEKRSKETLFLEIEDQSFVAGELVPVSFKVDRDHELSGLQFTLEFNHNDLLFVGLDGQAIDMTQNNFALLNNYNGVMTFSINESTGITLNADDVLFTAYFETKTNGKLSQNIDVTSQVARAEAYSTELEVGEIDLVFRNLLDAEGEQLEVFQNEPNPFSNETEIAFYVPNDELVSLKVINANGQIVTERSQHFKKGIHSFRLNSEDLNATGVLLYRIETETSSITRKMIRVK